MFLRKFLPAACSLLLAGCVGARLFLRSDKYLREKVVAVLPLGDTDAGEAEVAKHILAMLGAFAPTLHRGARRVIITNIQGHVLCRSSIRDLFSDVLEALIEAAMAYAAFTSGHFDAVLSRLGTDDWIQCEWL